ncbi:MAG: class I SAM-dependent methyltransferase [Flavobacteriales bacterium]|jgi:ubiquinone/menaquinone biosynthesis C-methylase UbiE|nr:class I SAM-dependent methyltransferase [Flavobacteriales bacterium]
MIYMLKNYFSCLYRNTVKNYNSVFYSLFKQNKNARLLDCGCWNGVNTKKYGKIVGTDFLYGIEINKQKAKEASKKGIEVKTSDLNQKLPFKDNFFDVVIANHVIEHLIDVRLFVSEIHRVQKKNGYILLGTPNLASWHNIFALLLGLQPFSGPTIKPDYESDVGLIKDMNKQRLDKKFSGNKSRNLDHIKVMTTKALISLLNDFNFNVEKIKGFGYYPFPPIIAKHLSDIDPYHSHYIIVQAKK